MYSLCRILVLGLGNNLISGVYVEGGGLTLLGTYTSDFASGTDSWGAFGVSAGTQALTANQSVGGVDGALKITYDANETGQFGLELATPWGEDFEVGDSIEKRRLNSILPMRIQKMHLILLYTSKLGVVIMVPEESQVV